MAKHPMQPLEDDRILGKRFKQNDIVRYLLDSGPYTLDDLEKMPFDQEHKEQFIQLIGYSLASFCELDYVSGDTYDTYYRAMRQQEEQKLTNAIIEAVQSVLKIAQKVNC